MATFTWTSSASGDWNTAGNWSPATVPDDTSADVLISLPGSYTITIRATDGCSSFTDATFTLTVNAPTCATPPAGMVAWYPGDGNAHDIKGGNNDEPIPGLPVC